MPTPNEGITCSCVMSPGISENLFTPTPTFHACFGRMSPSSNVKSPGLPSSAGIGFHLMLALYAAASWYEVEATAPFGIGAGAPAFGSSTAGAAVIIAGAEVAAGAAFESAGAVESVVAFAAVSLSLVAAAAALVSVFVESAAFAEVSAFAAASAFVSSPANAGAAIKIPARNKIAMRSADFMNSSKYRCHD